MPTNSQIKANICQKIGFFPAFLAPATQTPQVLVALGQQTVSAYSQNPLPTLFKEKLFVCLSHYCSVPYFRICHSCSLRGLGMTATEILKLHKLALPHTETDLEKDFQALSQPLISRRQWQTNSEIENSILRCAALLFCQPSAAETCRQKLRQFLGIVMYNHLIALLSYIKQVFQWVESYPEISYEKDQRAQLHLAPLLLEELELADYFQPQTQKHCAETINPTTAELVDSLPSQIKNPNLTQQRFSTCFVNAPFPMMIHSSDDKILYVNKIWTEITGYTAQEIPTLQDWTQRAKIQRQELVRSQVDYSPDHNQETEATLQQVVNSLLNLPYNLELQTTPEEIAITTRSEVTITTSRGEQRFWDFYSAPLAQLADGTELSISIAKDITNIIQTETELGEVKRQLELVLETSKGGIWDWNLDTNLVTLDARAVKLLSLSQQTCYLNYPSFLEKIHPSERQSVDLAVIKAVKAKREIELEYRVILSNQSIRWLKAKAKPSCDSWGRVVRVTGIIQDITREKQIAARIQQLDIYRQQDLVKSLDELENLLNLVPYYLFVIDKENLRISYCNRLFANSLGFDHPQQVRGKTIHECFPPENREHFLHQNHQVFTAGITVHQQESLILADGHHQFDTYKIPLKKPTGEVYALLQASSEMPSLVATQQALSERTVQLEAANRELESFSYSVSHDLQAPLRAINGFSQVIWERYQHKLDEQGKHYLSRILANSQRMGELIDALLTLSRVTRSQMKSVTVDLSAIAREIATELQSNHPERQVEFHIAPNLLVQGDPSLLRIVMNNLLDNAWKYTANQSSARIEVNAIAESAHKLAYFVRDNGAGFDPNYQSKLFNPFQRLHSATEFPGTGIGLATVRRIIYRHGGKVWAEGNQDRGAVFYFSLSSS